MADEKLRLGGMALPNGVLVHGPTAWACAVRTEGGELKVASGRKRFPASKIERPLVRGPARLVKHEGCGAHLIGPLLLTSAIGGTLAARAPLHLRALARAAGSVGAVAASTEIFGWMVRNPQNPLAKALARPGHELQSRLATAEPTAEQIEVAEAALAACLELERGDQASD